jgi:hypothetical protein
MKLQLVAILLLNFLVIKGQNDTILYFSKLNKVVDSKDNAFYYSKLIRNKKGNLVLKEYELKNNKWIDKNELEIHKETDSSYAYVYNSKNRIHSISFKKRNNGFYIKEYINSILIREGLSKTLFPQIRDGQWKEYRQFNGEIMTEDEYKDNQLITNKFWALDGTCISDVFNYVDKDPEYEGGESELLKFISKSCHYPQEARDENISGRVIALFVLTKDGNIKGIEIIGRVYYLLDLEAIRVLNLIPSEKWKPAEIDNMKVNMFYMIPISFNLR